MDINKIEEPKKRSFAIRYLESLKNTLTPVLQFLFIAGTVFGVFVAIALSMIKASLVPIFIYITYIILLIAYTNMEHQ